MIIGLTENNRNAGKEQLQKKSKLIATCFLIACLLPLFAWTLFRFNIVSSAPVFRLDIQQPVAKVMTNTSIGTAFMVSPTKLLTARHVLAGLKEGDKVQLTFEKLEEPRNVEATILFIAPVKSRISGDSARVPVEYFLDDIAVLEIASINDITPLDIGSSDAVALLDDVILIGYPNGDYSITKGNINNDKFQSLDLFKLDAVSNPGNSGGPCILKEDNSVVGILVGGSGPDMQGENIAVKINTVKALVSARGIDLTK
ncbi:MAG: serine protease [Chitinophagaceae bacterium]